tara:strand:- start:388 stop:975 length:588 start_codon:yes stop_codon:yes gene_type:complete
MLLFPNLIIIFIPSPVNDGLRLFLWVLPYFCIVPGLTVFFLLENFNNIISKITSVVISIFVIYYLFNFVLLTPYHYTYLNFLSGKAELKYQKFENDYWAISIGELIKKVNFRTDELIKIGTCGFISTSPKPYLKNRPNIKYKFVHADKADYIIMTNRVSRHHGVMNCFDIFKGEDIAAVKRNGMTLSLIRKIKTF